MPRGQQIVHNLKQLLFILTIIIRPVCFTIKWFHICKDRALVGWPAQQIWLCADRGNIFKWRDWDGVGRYLPHWTNVIFHDWRNARQICCTEIPQPAVFHITTVWSQLLPPQSRVYIMTLPRVECVSGQGVMGLWDQLGVTLKTMVAVFGQMMFEEWEARTSTVCEQHQEVVSGYLVRLITNMSSFFRLQPLNPPQQESMIG